MCQGLFSTIFMHNFSPTPAFSSFNPYWRPDLFLFVRPEYRPCCTAQDFLYASAYEITARDIHGAYCVREAMQRSFWVGLRLNRLKYIEKEKVNE